MQNQVLNSQRIKSKQNKFMTLRVQRKNIVRFEKLDKYKVSKPIETNYKANLCVCVFLF